MEQLFAVQGKARRAVGHHALTLGLADRLTQIGAARGAVAALATLGRVKRDHVVALLHGRHALAHIDDHASTFMAQDCREQAFRIGAREREFVGMANAGGFDFDQHLAIARSLKVNGFNRKRLSGLKGNGGASFHGKSSRTSS